MTRKFFLPSVLCILAGGLPAAYADNCAVPEPPNLVKNGSFECNGINSPRLVLPITGWTVKGNDPRVGHTSLFDATLVGHAEYLAICTVGKLGVISQDINTVPGQGYTFTFSFSSDAAEGNFFQAKWGNQVV